MSDTFRDLCEEQLKWLIELQVTSNLNDDAFDELGNLIDRCHDALRQVKVLEEFVKSQKPMPPDIQVATYTNLWELYETNE